MRNGKGTGVEAGARGDTGLTKKKKKKKKKISFPVFGPPLPSRGHMENKQSLLNCQKSEKTLENHLIYPTFIEEDIIKN